MFCFVHEHDLGSCIQVKVRRTSQLNYVLEMFCTLLCLPPLYIIFFFPSRLHTISLLSTDSRTLCYPFLFGGRFSSCIHPMIPTDDKIQKWVCKVYTKKNEGLLKLHYFSAYSLSKSKKPQMALVFYNKPRNCFSFNK